MATATHKFQAPKGTRDFYPPDMAVRRHIEACWRTASINHGFEEIDGPTFEHLDLYTVKSGPGIVSELFSFRRAGGESDYALRPEFTPTLARMVVARGAQLPKPIKWFCMPAMFRAERPQRGRLREHIQWNVDVVGVEDASADAEVVAVMVAALEMMGLTAKDVRVRVSHRPTIARLLRGLGIDEDRLPDAFALLDRREKIRPEEFAEQAAGLGLDGKAAADFDEVAGVTMPLADGWAAVESRLAGLLGGGAGAGELDELREVCAALEASDVGAWCDVSLGIVRGLAYYTGAVFEIHEASGAERAVAGGGRYDNLVELFGGPPTPAVGIAMGDVVIRLILEDRGLLEPAGRQDRPDVFVVNVRDESPDAHLRPIVARLRRAGWHTRHSYRETRKLGKLLADAEKCRARWAVILGDELDGGRVTVKDLDSGEQREMGVDELSGFQF